MSKKIIVAFLISIFAAGIISLSSAAHAQTPTSIIDSSSAQYQTGNYQLNDFLFLAIRVSKIILGFVGILSLIMFIYGGLRFLISAGSADSISKGKNILTAAVIGLVIVFSSYLIIQFVLSSMGLNWNGEAVDSQGNIIKLNNLNSI